MFKYKTRSAVACVVWGNPHTHTTTVRSYNKSQTSPFQATNFSANFYTGQSRDGYFSVSLHFQIFETFEFARVNCLACIAPRSVVIRYQHSELCKKGFSINLFIRHSYTDGNLVYATQISTNSILSHLLTSYVNGIVHPQEREQSSSGILFHHITKVIKEYVGINSAHTRINLLRSLQHTSIHSPFSFSALHFPSLPSSRNISLFLSPPVLFMSFRSNF